MVPDIFYPILTLKMTVLAFYTKEIGGLAPTRASPWTPWWAYSSPIPPHPPYPQLQKKRCAHIFCGLSPGILVLCSYRKMAA